MSDKRKDDPDAIPAPPRGLAAILVIGPGLVWCGEYIGSGEVILATRNGAIFGVAILWAPFLAIFAKYWIGLAGAHYTVTTGEGMIDMLSRTPGPRNWVVWPVFIGQLCSSAVSTAALATAAGAFASRLVPLPQYQLGWIALILVIAVTWSGLFEPLKRVMALLVLLIIVGTFLVAYETWPGISAVARGLIPFPAPAMPDWMHAGSSIERSSWSEIVPLLGWAAGGFASQVWYTYWVLGAGYGMAHKRGYGAPLDKARLRTVSLEEAQRLLAWRRMVTVDATVALIIGVSVTSAFMIAGSGVLGPMKIAPDGEEVATTLSLIFGQRWGETGAYLFLVAGLAAMLSTMLGQFAGWPRLLADCARVLFPAVSRWSWKVQFRSILILYALSNMVIVYWLGLKPVILVQLGALLDGLLLTPLQAFAVGLGLYYVMPKFFSEEVRPIIRAHKVLAFGLALAFVVFGYFCIVQIPNVVRETIQKLT